MWRQTSGMSRMDFSFGAESRTIHTIAPRKSCLRLLRNGLHSEHVLKTADDATEGAIVVVNKSAFIFKYTHQGMGHIRRTPSSPAVAKNLPSGETATMSPTPSRSRKTAFSEPLESEINADVVRCEIPPPTTE